MSAKVLKIIGNILIILVILAAAPIALPKLFGLQEYNVISGSMEPTISVGSIVYVRGENFDQLSVGDIIAFESGASIVTHRITDINANDMLITTKGDANNTEDFTPVAYTNVVGKVVAHFPIIGYVAGWLSTVAGKLAALIALLVGVILSTLSESKTTNNGKWKKNNDNAINPSEYKGGNNNINPKAILALGLVIVFGSMGGFLYIFMGYQKTNDLYNSLNESYVQISTDTSGQEDSWQDMIDIDFDALTMINPDVVGWIYVEGTDISYPIMYAGDDEAYLRTTIAGEHATAGSIFLEGYNLPDFTDSHNIIYGHNMRNLSMFGSLKFYKSEDNYLDEHRYFQILTPDYKMRFEIFSYFDTEPASWVYAVPYSDSEEFEDYISELLTHSYEKIDLERDITSKDQIVTLSTCSANEMRFTVHGALQERISNQN